VLEGLALDSLILHPVLSFSSLAVFSPVLSGPNYDFGPWSIHPVLFSGFRPIALRPRLSPGLRFRSAFTLRQSGNLDLNIDAGFRPMTLRHWLSPVLRCSGGVAILAFVRMYRFIAVMTFQL